MNNSTNNFENITFYDNESRSLEAWLNTINHYITLDKPFKAYEMGKVAEKIYNDSIELKQRIAFSLLKIGAVHEAIHILEPLVTGFMSSSQQVIQNLHIMKDSFQEVLNSTTSSELSETLKNSRNLNSFIMSMKSLTESVVKKADDEEAIGLLAKAYKEIWRQTGEKEFALKALNMYKFSYDEHSERFWSGINVASMYLAVKNNEKARETARLIINTCKKQISEKTANSDELYWLYATMGEASFILDNHDDALNYYESAKTHVNGQFYKVTSSLKQLKLIAENHLLENFDHNAYNICKDILKPAVIAVFTGHMIDKPDRKTERFPDYLEHDVRQAIETHIDQLGVNIGYTSAACGSDILFIEAMLARGNEVNIVLPFCKEDFIKESVQFAGVKWVKRFQKCLKASDSIVFVTQGEYFNEDSLFDYHNTIMNGHALLRAHDIDTRPHLITVLEADNRRKTGGTHDNVAKWPFQDTITTIHLKDIRENTTSKQEKSALMKTHPQENIEPKAAPSTERNVLTMLFADIINYSHLEELNYPAFVNVLEKLSHSLGRLEDTPNMVNTWGDAIFAVMNQPSRILNYAFQLQNFFANTDFIKLGLPKHLEIRIALHSGPVFQFTDPLTRRPNFYGSHVNRAARLEPITINNHIYATEQFVAQLIAEDTQKQVERDGHNISTTNFVIKYVGKMELAKNFGRQIVYHIRQKTIYEMNRMKTI